MPGPFIFFDLDNTLVDHSLAEKNALYKTYTTVFGEDTGFEPFRLAYHAINLKLWDAYSRSEVSKEEVKFGRFDRSVGQLTRDKVVIDRFTAAYYENYIREWQPVAGADKVLEYVKKADYRLGILSNGFTELQYLKIKNLGWESFFEVVVLSEEAGVQKPDPGIFRYAEQRTGLSSGDHLYIGDSFETDVLGSHAAGWKTVFFDYSGKSGHSDPALAVVQGHDRLLEAFPRILSLTGV